MKTEKYYSKIGELPKNERPRELLFEHGPEYLSDQQLIAIMLGSGTRGNDVMKLSEAVLEIYQKNPVEIIEPDRFCDIDGLGAAKAAQLSAALEFARRRMMPSTKRISSPADAVPLLFHYASCRKEHFLCISLNGAHEVIAVRVVSIGTLNRTLVHPREVFTDPLADTANGIICAHNHPSGNTEPSREDIELTERLREAGILLGINLLDHLIISETGYYSFLENGLL
ncbi:MAG: DNA repair protein RadC [Spirochaetales bacterium]|uniref:DNA repair protein RadC n=1 Tax=Candidatus Thalassospirochaeta sargassi TaxID=3119039 RepID=A0AAJ1MNR8_9SPIO|nr:DNA repair protein RadC [Spirochaetales bacterium]